MQVLKRAPALAVTFALAAQAAAYYAVASRSEVALTVAPLAEFPRTIAGWAAARDFEIEKEVQDVLRADDILSRVYVDPGQSVGASLFIAFFRTQRFGQSPHSPKNCLPGAGWEPTEDRTIAL